MTERIDLGTVSQMVAKVDQHEPEFFNLIFTDESGEKESIRASRDAAKSLWSHLTGILYPRAAMQIATGTSTVKRDKEDVPPDVSYMSVAYINEEDPETVIISCTSREVMWTIRMSHENADDLWASLEDKLDQV